MGIGVVTTATRPRPRQVVRSLPELTAQLCVTGLGDVLLLVDPQLAGTPVETDLRDALTLAGGSVSAQVARPLPEVADLSHAASGLRDGDTVVALGGGLVMDQAKVVSLLAADPGSAQRLTTRHRCGFVAVPNAVRRRTGLVIVPSTLGTGAELSHSACVQHGGRKKLVYGTLLGADSVLHTADATRTLPGGMVLEGVVEALLRLLWGHVGTRAPETPADEHCLALARRLTALGDEVRRTALCGGPVPDDVLVEIATLSGTTHSTSVTDLREPYADTCWPLANELSTRLGCRKVSAMAILSPVLWRRVEAGDRRVGSVERLHSAWCALRETSAYARGDLPSQGLATLLDAWGVERPAAPALPSAEELSERAADAWGRGLPMLRGLTPADLTQIYAAGLEQCSTTGLRPHESGEGGEHT